MLAPSWKASWAADSGFVSRLRTRAWYREMFLALRYCIFPTILVWGPISFAVGYWFPGAIRCLLYLWAGWFALNVAFLIVPFCSLAHDAPGAA